MFWLMDQASPVHFAVTAQITGRTNPRDWRSALNRVQERHPLLSVHIENQPGRGPWFKHVPNVPIPLRIVEKEPATSWETEVGKELATPFDSNRAPLIRAVLIQGVDEAAFILVGHHAVVDGKSLVYLLRDTLRVLTGAPLETLPVPPATDEMLALDFPQLRPDDGKPAHSEAVGTPSIYRPRDGARPTIRGLRLPPDLTASLKRRSRYEGATVHGAICAALARGGRLVLKSWRQKPVRVMSPVDARPALQVGDDCGVFLSAATVAFGEEAMSFWDLARYATNSVASAKSRASIAAVTGALRQAIDDRFDVTAAAVLAAQAFAREAMLTNLGAVPFGGRFGHLTVRALWGPTVLSGFVGEQTIGVATLDGSLYLTHACHTPPNGLLTAMHDILAQIA
jgi:NRPS condensation-like uncharacterized protein